MQSSTVRLKYKIRNPYTSKYETGTREQIVSSALAVNLASS